MLSGIFSTILYFYLWCLSHYLYSEAQEQHELDFHLKLFGIIFALGWAGNFIGHGFFEKRSPSFVSNPLNGIVAPNFVILEILFFIGYKNELYEEA